MHLNIFEPLILKTERTAEVALNIFCSYYIIFTFSGLYVSFLSKDYHKDKMFYETSKWFGASLIYLPTVMLAFYWYLVGFYISHYKSTNFTLIIFKHLKLEHNQSES